MNMLIAYLLGILTAIKPKNDDSTKHQEATKADYHYPHADRPISVICVPPTHNDEENSQQNKKRRRKAILFWVQIGTLFFIFVYNGITFLIWRASIEANKTTREALVSVQRAFVIPHEIEQTRHVVHDQTKEYAVWDFTMPCENTGTTPANIVTQAFFSDMRSTEPPEQVFAKKPLLLQNAVLGPKATRNVGWVRLNDSDIFGHELPHEGAALLKMPIQTVSIIETHVFWGWVAYRDVFPKTSLHITEFCRLVSGVVIKRDLQNMFSFGYVPCDHHNCADEYCDDYRQIAALSTREPIFQSNPIDNKDHQLGK